MAKQTEDIDDIGIILADELSTGKPCKVEIDWNGVYGTVKVTRTVTTKEE